MVDLYKYIDFNLKEEEKGNKEFEKILKEVCKNKLKAKGDRMGKIPLLDTKLDNCIVVLGLPKAPEAKMKLIEMIFEKKILPKLNLQDSFVSLKLEIDQETKILTGIAIIEFANPDKAEIAANSLNRFILDVNHTLTSLTFADFKNIFEIEKNMIEPKFLQSKDLVSWTQEMKLYSKFIAYDNSSISYYNLENLKLKFSSLNEISITGEQIKDIKFSSSGNYMIVLKTNSFDIYGGQKLTFITRFVHKEVKEVKFSQNEKYLMSCNGTTNEVKNSENIIVWNFYTGKKLRIFKLTDEKYKKSFDFSYDSSYFSGIQVFNENKHVFIYELPSMKVVEDPTTKKRSQLLIKNPITCKWASNNNMIITVNEYDELNGNSFITLFMIPSRNKIEKNLRFELDDVDIKWACDDSFVSFNFYCKGKKKENIAVFCYVDIKKFNIFLSNLDSVEKGDEPELKFSPNGKNLVMLNPKKNNKFNIEFYNLNSDDQKPKLLSKMENENKKKVHFCPNSKFVVLVDVNGKNVLFAEYKLLKGKIEFKEIKEVEMTSTFKYLKWSPCGRFVAFIRNPRNNVDITIHDCYGRALNNYTCDKKIHFSWRSFDRIFRFEAPESQTNKFKQNVRKNYDNLFEEDEKIIDAFKVNERNAVKKNFGEFMEYFKVKTQEWKDTRNYRISLLGHDEDDEEEYVVVTRVDKEALIEKIIIEN